jgi:hypothetical protein
MKESSEIERGDHYLNEGLETDPEFYKTVFFSGTEDFVRKTLKKGSRLAISVNMENFNIIIGSDHMGMQITHSVPDRHFCAGYAKLNVQTGKIEIEDFSDWRNGASNGAAVRKCIGDRLTRDILE